MEDLANIIRTLRRERGLTQRDLAIMSGVAHSTIGAIESGGSGGNVYTVETILDALGYELIIKKKQKPSENHWRLP